MKISGVCAGIRQFLLALSLIAVLAGSALAQSTTDGAINGTVYDASGKVVPNATVTVKNNGTNA
ncbi:MAG: carboxypeptidase-like regulatory domain-containing protein, partial [Acidobacteriota bacterium]